MSAAALAQERVWFEKSQYAEAGAILNGACPVKQNGAPQDGNLEVIYSDIAKLRQLLSRVDAIAASGPTTDHDKFNRIVALEKENATLRKLYDDLKKSSEATEKRVQALEQRLQGLAIGGSASSAAPVPAAAKPASAKNDDDDDMDLFGSDSEEDEAAAKVREQRLADYAAKKSKKPALIAKSNIILDVKPWDDETDMKAMETEVRKIVMDGLLWGASKLVPLAYGIKKLQISCVVEDDKVSIDLLTEQIEGLEDLVQSVDVAAFNKI